MDTEEMMGDEEPVAEMSGQKSEGFNDLGNTVICNDVSCVYLLNISLNSILNHSFKCIKNSGTIPFPETIAYARDS